MYHQTSNIRHIVVDNIRVNHSDVVGASPFGAPQSISSFSTSHMASMDWAKATVRRSEDEAIIIYVLEFGASCIRYFTVIILKP